MKRTKNKTLEKRRRKSSAGYLAGGGKSTYAIKQAEQRNGKFRATSPFTATSATHTNKDGNNV